jgi:hypothetical protein
MHRVQVRRYQIRVPSRHLQRSVHEEFFADGTRYHRAGDN